MFRNINEYPLAVMVPEYIDDFVAAVLSLLPYSLHMLIERTPIENASTESELLYHIINGGQVRLALLRANDIRKNLLA